MPINETVLIKAAGTSLTRTLGFPLKEAFNVLDVSTLRLQNSSNANQAATFTVGARWNGLPTDTAKPIKWVHVTFEDTGTARDLHVVDTGGSVPATTNPVVVTNNTNDITVSNGVCTAVFNKTTDSANLLTSFLAGATEVLHGSNKPRLSVPTDKKTKTTWTSSAFDFAAIPTDSTIKLANASVFAVSDTVKFAWEGTVQDYFPTGGADGHPFIIMDASFTLPDMTRALMTSTHRIQIILNYGVTNNVVSIDYSDSQGFCLLAAPPITPTPGMKIRIQEVESATTKTISSINAGANTATFSTTIGQYIPQGVDLVPTVAASSTALAQIVAGGTVIEKQYGDKAVIIKQTCVLKDGGSNIEPNLTFEIRHWLYANKGFVRSRITLRNTVQAISTAACPSVFFKALNFDIPTVASSTTSSDSVTTESASVARYKANNLHATLNHTGLANLQFCVHEHGVQFPNIATVDSTGFHFEIFPVSVGPIEFEGGVIKSREVFWGLNAANGLVIPDTLGATFDPAYIAQSKAVRPNMVEKRNWATVFASEPQKFRDACAWYERLMACVYDISVCEATQVTRPAQTLYEHRYALQEAGYGTYPFGWNKFGNTAEDVGFGNNRYDLIYCLLREGLRESDATKSALAWKLALQNGRNRVELGQLWNHQSQAGGTPDMYGLARYERAYAPDPFNYTNSPLANPTHSWNEGSCLLWALTDDPIVKEAAYAGVLQARQYDYQGTFGHRLYGTGAYTTKDPVSGNGNAEPRFAGWPIHTLITGYRYFGEAIDLQRAQDYATSFVVTMAGEPADDGFTDFRTGAGQFAPLFQHGGYCMHGIIETWRESAGAVRTSLGNYISKVAKMLAYGSSALSAPGANSPLLANGTVHPVDNTKYNPAVTFPFTYQRSFADTLATGINTTDTTITLTDASTFNLGLNNKTGVLMGNINNPTTWEYFTYTGVSGNSLTGVVRNFGGSGAKSFSAGAAVYPTGFGGAYNDIIVATLIMGARISGDAALQTIAQKVWEDNCLYRDQDPGNFITIGTYMPVNLWFRNISTNSLKLYAQGATALSEFLGDRLSAPGISSLSPNAVTAGASTFTMTVNGSNFATDAVVKWNGTNLTTTFVSSTQLTASVPAGNVVAAGTASVTVMNVADNTTSNAATFTINASGPGAPSISSISPNTAIVGTATGALTITGTALGTATVTVDGLPVTPTSNTATQIVLPSQTFAMAGAKTVVVATAGGSTNTTIQVNNPAPTVSGIAPNNATVGAGQLTLNVTGLGFVSGSVVRWNGADLTTTYVSATQLTAIVPAGLLTAAGVATVTVFTATPGGGTSAGQVFTINAVGPAISSITPASGLQNVATGPITINGTNLGSATVSVAGVSVTPTSNTATQIILPSQTFATTGAKSVIVTTAGGSATTTISITPPPPPPPPTTGGITLQGATNVFIGAWQGQPALINTNTPGGGNSTQEIPVGYTGYVAAQLLTAKQDTHFGLSSANTGSNPAAINFAIHFKDDYTVEIKASGTVIYATGVAPNQIQTWERGDQFQVYVERDRILFMRGWKVFHTVARPAGVAYRFACTTNGLTAALGNPVLHVEGAQ